ncbi:MAG: phosphoribosylaminoimidazolesuccinocarboxamide synthase [Candidatus Cloacimonetes bacterium]|jgi:phosphoribosylaminoimidazole-succinocarboxamide synthase|nr:phosphoribosylaminoimidazolesuccinocarboxamide synthase [Candidatus Cloacimonadota bacterium]MDD2422745.1 phosphoribosylaminoimidazolesuccinocarboxamide synthase [Candidatus Cloacimonadota bacterium]MDD3563163.1 phosphoribosylaminoimidazolesuccinocarboxamide synthase [Candidatus Cloacimonadota bacterium]MDD4276824.1 phosphoribosylaminoimidazolesuccinocarboxamide synthase [Candidatus Cloacimonadota bacterium]MDY0324551.1 phosphoribosylaminoimidazolesuccinocarboxamide synthase [Candidatus Cloa
MHNELNKVSIVKSSQQGKVRDIYDLGEELLIVTSDRISAFDVVFPNLIPDKGKVLSGISAHFFKETRDIVPNHFITDKVEEYPKELHTFKEYLQGRSMLVKKTRVIPFECIVRGYISGSAWIEYQRTSTVGGMMIPEDMQQSQKFPKPLFTPSTKATEGHDVNISYREMLAHMDEWIARELKDKSVTLYNYAHDLLKKSGILVADTKFEFGSIGSQIILIDECLTPDSSRFWDIESYEIGESPKSYDKQYIRDFLNQSGWNKQPPAPTLPDEIIQKTREKYLKIYKIITGKEIS